VDNKTLLATICRPDAFVNIFVDITRAVTDCPRAGEWLAAGRGMGYGMLHDANASVRDASA